MHVIELRDIHKNYKKKPILKGLNLEVKNGEIFGFVGPNGAGKSTTMKIIVDLIKPSSGKVYIFGKENTDPEVKKRVGFLPEHPYFYTNVKGEEFLRFVYFCTDVNKKEFERRVEYYGDKLEISWALDKKLSEYSKGMLQRFGILQAVVSEPDLLILDEPMSGLDPIGRKLVMGLMEELREKGKTIFFSTHILPDVERVCDRVAIIINGRITDVLGREDIKNIEELFLNRVKEADIREVR